MKMHQVTFISIFVILIFTACAKAPINPGDKIGNFIITTGKDDEVTFMYELDASDVQSNETELEIPWETKLVCSYGLYDNSYSGKLDEVWANQTYQLEINGRPVNLEAFGTIETEHSMVGTMRFYNVVIEPNNPGKLTVHHVGNTGDADFDDTLTLIFLPVGE